MLPLLPSLRGGGPHSISPKIVTTEITDPTQTRGAVIGSPNYIISRCRFSDLSSLRNMVKNLKIQVADFDRLTLYPVEASLVTLASCLEATDSSRTETSREEMTSY